MKLVNQSKSISILTLVFSILLQSLCIRHVVATSQCKPFEWMCDDQVSCIDDDEKCDGHADCPDGSDEIAVNCYQKTKCPTFAFQCSYGGCIAGRGKCDGKPDCADNSDEIFCGGSVAAANIQGTCRSADEMQCLISKECIDSSDICDGRADCSDGTDETLELCGRDICPTGFRCGYGACVSGFASCNGSAECRDGSDEAWQLCGYERKFSQITTTAQPIVENRFEDVVLPCKIPEDLSRVVVTDLISAERISPGTFVDDDMSITAKCEKEGDNPVDLFCLNGTWVGNFPTCSVFCDRSKLLGISTTFVCDRYGTEHESLCKPVVLVNTSIRVYCAPGYRRSSLRAQELQCHKEGVFSEKRLPCEQHCGQLKPTVQGLIRNGSPIIPSKAPWHVSIYRNDDGEYMHICGGSIISPRLIISAAHCFWNKTRPTSPDLYRIIAGKTKRKYTVDESEGFPQTIEVEQIFISDKYNDVNELNNHFYADIAIMKLKKPLIYNENVTSICLDDPQGDSQDYIRSNRIGSITGFGRSGVLERLSMSTISNDECQNLPDGSSLASDKFCLRNDNFNSTLCQGDSGGGFVEMRNDAFYLLGIVSYTPSTQQSCVTSKFVGLSNVRYMRKDLFDDWQREMAKDKEMF